MEYELKELENIISDVLQPGKQRQTKLTIEFITEIRLKLKTECERIKKKLAFEVCDHRNPTKRLKQIVHQHQHAIVAMIDLVNHHVLHEKPRIKVPTTKKAYNDLLKEVLKAAEDLYQFLRQGLPWYFDADANIPVSIKMKIEEEVRELMNETKEFLGLMGTDEQLINIIRDPFDKLLKEENVGYQELHYLKKLNLELKNVVNQDSALKELLQLNFNSHRFFNYYIEKIKPGNEKEMTTSELIVYYTYEMKIVNQTASTTNTGLNTQLPSIRDQLVSWIAEEVFYLEKKLLILNHPQELNVANKGSDYKVQTSLTVSHLALAVKLLLDADIIQNKNVTELLKNVAKNFKTKKSETISEDSLRNKSYNYEARTVNEMKDVIIGLLNQVKRYLIILLIGQPFQYFLYNFLTLAGNDS